MSLSHSLGSPSEELARRVATLVQLPFVSATPLSTGDLEISVNLRVDPQATVRPDAFRMRSGLISATTLLRQATSLAEDLIARESAGRPARVRPAPTEDFFGSFTEHLAWGEAREEVTRHYEYIVEDLVGIPAVRKEIPALDIVVGGTTISILLSENLRHAALVTRIAAENPSEVAARVEASIGQSLRAIESVSGSAVWIWTDVLTDLFADPFPDPLVAAAAFHRAIPQHLASALEVVYAHEVEGADPEAFLRRLAS